MARITKDPQVRMAEILDTAEELFYAKGYHETQISDIVKKIGVAQGTFYYYFKSKEEILEALINRQMKQVSFEMEKLTSNTTLDPLRKMELFFETLLNMIRYEDGLLFEFLYNDRYLHLLDKLNRLGEELISPFMLRIIAEGQEKSIFHVSHPEVAQAFIGSIIDCMFDVTYKKLPTDLYLQYVEMAEVLIEKTLGLAAHSQKKSPGLLTLFRL